MLVFWMKKQSTGQRPMTFLCTQITLRSLSKLWLKLIFSNVNTRSHVQNSSYALYFYLILLYYQK